MQASGVVGEEAADWLAIHETLRPSANGILAVAAKTHKGSPQYTEVKVRVRVRDKVRVRVAEPEG